MEKVCARISQHVQLLEEFLKACLEDLAYLKDQPTVTDVNNMLSKQREISDHSNGVTEVHPDNEYTI